LVHEAGKTGHAEHHGGKPRLVEIRARLSFATARPGRLPFPACGDAFREILSTACLDQRVDVPCHAARHPERADNRKAARENADENRS
jgi:hypothetical protein